MARESGPVRTALLVALAKSLPFLLAAAAVLVVVLLFAPVFGKPIVSLSTQDDSAASELLLEEIRDAYRIDTVEYLYKVVFPYDFDAPGASLSIYNKRLAKPLAPPASVLDPDELAWWQAARLSRRCGLKIYDPDYQFLVVTVVVRAGFDLKGSGLDGSAPPGGARKLVSLSSRTENGKTVRSATVALPPVAIAEVVVEDPAKDQYPFPDVGIAPGDWKDIAALIEDYGRKRSLREGILAQAQENAQNFIRELLATAGIAEVSFSR